MKQLLLFLTVAQSFALTELCGKLQIPTSLIRSKSPYLITGDLYVPPHSRLTIESGVELLIADKEKCQETTQQDYSDSTLISIKIDGSFFVDGNADFPVVIKPQNPKKGLISWDGIRIWNASPLNAYIQFLHISGAHKAIHTYNSRFNIANSLFSYNNTGIYLRSNANLSIFNNNFIANEIAGIYQESSAPKIFANLFVQNISYGIWSDSRQAPVISTNGFWQNGEADCFHCPYQIGRIEESNWLGDSTDQKGNLFKDPYFIDSPSEKAKRAKDLSIDTPLDQVKDSVIAQELLQAKKRYLNLGITTNNPFKPIGKGPYLLSKYSPYVQTAPDEDFFLNEDERRGDIGMHGGRPDRVKKKSPLR